MDDAQEKQIAAMAPNDMIGVLSLVLSQLGDTERRILHQINENAKAAHARWLDHEGDHQEIARLLAELKLRLDDHLREEEEEDLIMQARLGPIKKAGQVVGREWRTVLIVGLLIADLVARALGFHSLFPPT